MDIKSSIKQTQINKVKKRPLESHLLFKEYGKSENIKEYTDAEIAEMLLGVYKDTNKLLVDGDYIVDLNKVIKIKCQLEQVTYFNKPNIEDYETNAHNRIDNIRTFYVKDYYLETEEEFFGLKEHRITSYLYQLGLLRKGRNEFRGLYSISNGHATLESGKAPKDLFHPIKFYINRLFFNDDYWISDFIVDSKIKIHSGNQ